MPAAMTGVKEVRATSDGAPLRRCFPKAYIRSPSDITHDMVLQWEFRDKDQTRQGLCQSEAAHVMSGFFSQMLLTHYCRSSRAASLPLRLHHFDYRRHVTRRYAWEVSEYRKLR